MREVVRSRSVAAVDATHDTCAEVVYISTALSHIVEIVLGTEDVVVHKIRSVGNLDHQVAVVRIVQIAGDMGTLGLPVEPGTERTVVDVVVAYGDIDCSMKLDSGNLVTEILMLHGDIVDVVVLDCGEDAAHVAYDAVLAAVMQDIVADDVRTDGLAAPADARSPEYSLHLVLVARLALSACAHVVARALFLADTDGTALGIMDIAVLDDPLLAPVGAEKARLVSGRRSPWTCCLAHLESAHGDIVASCPAREEAGASNVDLHELSIRVCTLEIGVDDSLVSLVIDLAVPLVDRILRMEKRLRNVGPWWGHARHPLLRIDDIRVASGLVERLAVEIDIAKVERKVHQDTVDLVRLDSVVRIDEPVAFEDFAVWIESAEIAVRENQFPDIAFNIDPSLCDFGALDHRMLAGSRHVCDSRLLGDTGIERVDPLAVLAAMDDDGVARHRDRGSLADCPERSALAAAVVVFSC